MGRWAVSVHALGDAPERLMQCKCERRRRSKTLILSELGHSEASRCWVLAGFARAPYLKVMILESTITCPRCGQLATETMPTDACQFFYDCKGCGERLKP